ncbi:unnamed protein product [Lymnaea stagnalis]|uniref:UspA domain-containing protein n=1 Tax=Lymnaea stagnalis TaxID=6523 RepID=A0AAV2GXR9_LYMST
MGERNTIVGDDRTKVDDRYMATMFVDNVVKQGRHYSFEGSQVVMPVTWDTLSQYTFHWYLANIHKPNYQLNICHVPAYKDFIKVGMSQGDVLELMKEAEVKSTEIKRVFEKLLTDNQIVGRVLRIAGNSTWSAIVELCKLVRPCMVVMGTQTLYPPGRPRIPDNHSLLRKESRALVSSVTNDVMLHSVYPMVIVRMPCLEEAILEEERTSEDSGHKVATHAK